MSLKRQVKINLATCMTTTFVKLFCIKNVKYEKFAAEYLHSKFFQHFLFIDINEFSDRFQECRPALRLLFHLYFESLPYLKLPIKITFCTQYHYESGAV